MYHSNHCDPAATTSRGGLRWAPLCAAAGVLFFFTACASREDDSTPSDDEHGHSTNNLEPPPAGKGVQLKMVSSLGPREEVERCMFYVIPEDGLHVNSETTRYTAGSHHCILYYTGYAQVPQVDKLGNAHSIKEGDIFDCSAGPVGLWDTRGVIGGSQSSSGPGTINNLPSDVAIRLDPGSVVLMNTHYLNVSSETLMTDARMNLNTIPKEAVKHEAGTMFHYNPFIYVPPMGKSTARMKCHMPHDVTLLSGQSHMHSRAVYYEANLLDQDGSVIEQLYTNTKWEDVPVMQWPSPGKQIAEGQTIDFRCDFENDEDREIIQGITTKDEMCMFVGVYYPRSAAVDACTSMTYVGSGTTSCLDTMLCLKDAKSAASTFNCVVSSCAAVDEPLTDFLACQQSQKTEACEVECAAEGEACGGCLQTACAAQIATCAQAQCD
jgi:hypothetical protein